MILDFHGEIRVKQTGRVLFTKDQILLGYRVTCQLAAVARDERGVLKFVRAGAKQPVAVDVRGKDDACPDPSPAPPARRDGAPR